MNCTIAVRFVDTNILLYAISTASDEALKREIARRLLDSADVALSVQVLQEFFVQATRQTRADALTSAQASALIEAWLRFPVQETTVPLMQAAIDGGQEQGTALDVEEDADVGALTQVEIAAGDSNAANQGRP